MRHCDSGGCIYCPFAIIEDGVITDCIFARKIIDFYSKI